MYGIRSYAIHRLGERDERRTGRERGANIYILSAMPGAIADSWSAHPCVRFLSEAFSDGHKPVACCLNLRDRIRERLMRCGLIDFIH